MRRRWLLPVISAGLVLNACGGESPRPPSPTAHEASASPTAGSTAGSTAAPAPGPAVTPVGDIRLERVARLAAPTAMAVRRGDPTLYVLEQSGTVRAIRAGRVQPSPVLDIRSRVRAGGEQGLLGIAFSPDGRYLYLDYTDNRGDTHVTEWAVRAGGRIDTSSRRDVLTQDQPYANHNGGQLAFGPDGYLYIGLGDGGSGGDPHGNGQSLDTWLGKILRIDPRPAGGRPYRVPPDNPFADRPSPVKPEIWAYGLRNPWRFSFDSRSGDLWIGDVGQNAWEEVNRQPAGSAGGENYGWNRREGLHRFAGARPRGAVDPVLEYPLHDGTCSVIGGTVYRGARIPGLAGRYVYGDFCAGWIRSAPTTAAGGGKSSELTSGIDQLSSFGADHDGELYAVSLSGPIYRLQPA